MRYLVSSICYLHARVAYPRSIPVADAINVTNTGKVAADHVVLGFLTPPGAGTHGVPLQSLFGFERVHVLPGQTVTVWLYPTYLDFALVQEDGNRAPLPGWASPNRSMASPTMLHTCNAQSVQY